MRLLPIIAAISLCSTAALAQNMDTSDRGNPNRPGHNMGMSHRMMHHHGMSHHRMMHHTMHHRMHKKMMKREM